MNQFISNKNLGSAGSELGYQDFERLNESPEIQQAIAEEFGSALQDGAESGDGFSRRHWLQIMGASLALGAAGCRYQPEQIVPYAFRPQNRTPGATVRYASMIDFAGAAHPIEALSFDGRPIKLDGNRLHEQTRNLSEKSPGPSSVFTQARVLELYDPDRLRTPLARENTRLVESNWNDFLAAFRVVMGQKDLSSVALLAEPSASPSMKRLQQEFVARGGHLHFFTPVLDDQAREGSKLAFGQVVRPLYELDKARVIVCLDADPLLMAGPFATIDYLLRAATWTTVQP